MQLSNNKILITGGASGIGRGLAERFVQEGNTVIICGRRDSALQEVATGSPSIITRQCDLSRKKERDALYYWISTEHSDLNVVVNNAGIQNWMNITDGDFFQRAQQEIAINIEALIHMTSIFSQLESLNTILNVSSGLSFVPLVKVPVYSATKAFVHSFTLSAREQLKPKGIEVIEVIPPALNADLGGKGLHYQAPPVSEFIDAVFAQLKEGKQELTFGFSETTSNAGQEILQGIFKRMNQTAQS